MHPNTVFIIIEMKLEAKTLCSFKIPITTSFCGYGVSEQLNLQTCSYLDERFLGSKEKKKNTL